MAIPKTPPIAIVHAMQSDPHEFQHENMQPHLGCSHETVVRGLQRTQCVQVPTPTAHCSRAPARWRRAWALVAVLALGVGGSMSSAWAASDGAGAGSDTVSAPAAAGSVPSEGAIVDPATPSSTGTLTPVEPLAAPKTVSDGGVSQGPDTDTGGGSGSDSGSTALLPGQTASPTGSTASASDKTPAALAAQREAALHPFGPRLQAAPFAYNPDDADARDGEPNALMGSDRALARRCAIVSQIVAEKDDPVAAALAEGKTVSVSRSQVAAIKKRAYANAQLRAQRMTQCMAEANDGAGPTTILGVLIGQAAMVQTQAIRLQRGVPPSHSLSGQEKAWEARWAEQTQIWFRKSIGALPKNGPDAAVNLSAGKAQEAIVDLAALFDEGDYILNHPKRPAAGTPTPAEHASQTGTPAALPMAPSPDRDQAIPSDRASDAAGKNPDSSDNPAETAAASVPSQPLDARVSKRRAEAQQLRKTAEGRTP